MTDIALSSVRRPIVNLTDGSFFTVLVKRKETKSCLREH